MLSPFEAILSMGILLIQRDRHYSQMEGSLH